MSSATAPNLSTPEGLLTLSGDKLYELIDGRLVEKHTNSIFAKLGLSEEKDLNRRVKAVLLYLAEGQGG